MRTGGNDERVQEPVAKIDRLIHEPSRYTLMAYLYVVEVADFLFLLRQTGMTWGNLSAHLGKLEAAGYLVIEKEFLGKKPHTTVRLSDEGRNAFEEYRGNMRRALDSLPSK
ncbi:MAG: transcriptional regulator [Dehalococcoidia bacterium]|nr:transcriptional regulator [Dehalococcoidia bacterium]MDH4367064.1 transcriptional regulator [Dehalococcoidia bacterium]